MILGPDTTPLTKILIQLALAHFPGVARCPPPMEVISLLAHINKEAHISRAERIHSLNQGCNHGLIVRTHGG